MTLSQSTQAQSANIELATNPSENIAVFASAGTGKTRLLVHRILKLLLNEVDPAHILAITFTRKAAAEMRERLMIVLADWAGFDDQQLQLALQQLAHPHDPDSITKARKLYEQILFSEYDIRITTFHAFCQDILKRFALHAGVPAGFHLLETTEELKQEAREQLYKVAHRGTDTNLTDALYELLKHSATVNNVNTILNTFIDSRSDWWSFTENQNDPITYATDRLQEYLFSNLDENSPIGPNAIDADTKLLPALQLYQTYLASHVTAKNQQLSNLLTTSLKDIASAKNLIPSIVPIFLTQKNQPRQLKASKALEKSLGSQKMLDFIQLHQVLCDLILQELDILKKENLLAFNQAWFYSGHYLLKIYQRLKFSRHALDFDDLEWHTYLLLTKHNSASWIQYKLDQRIEHILIDEFQDTNPTQWNLLFPLLEELAANLPCSNKSLFFVGDTKQSIYGFRRANPQLLFTASEWATQNLNAKLIETDHSYRSSPVIIDFVNRVFCANAEKPLLDGYRLHEAAQTNLWGQVQIDPLITPEEKVKEQIEFRNPLLQTKANTELNCHYLEGQAVAKHINKLIADFTPILEREQARMLRYSDIVILARNRTHLSQLELALREENIPYTSINNGEFLDQLEVQDILALLTYLSQPHNDLALTQTLRSPCFGISDEDLMTLADCKQDSWHEKLKSHAANSPNSLLSLAYEQLQKWQHLANRIPVHDLLDKIYFEINILTRYASCCMPTKKHQVLTNLTHLLQLTLDLDAGRYSSIQSFLNLIQKPGISNAIASDTKAHQQEENTIQLMTIHSAKGLEAPVIFLIDTGSLPPKQRAYETVINWPFKAQRPEQFFITGRKQNLDQKTQALLNQQSTTNWKEELNLLYVALTRAKQYLFISGVEAKRNQGNNWFSIIHQAIAETPKDSSLEAWQFKYGTPPCIKTQPSKENFEYIETTHDLSKPFTKLEKQESDAIELATANTALASYGTLVHKLFELLAKNKPHDSEALHRKTELALNKEISAKEFSMASKEVNQCLNASELKEIFTRESGKEILSEVPVCFIENGKALHRIIDRLVITESSVWIIDFKTTSEVNKDTMIQQAMQYQKQISSYFFAVKKLYPSKYIRASILFTSIPAIHHYLENEISNC